MLAVELIMIAIGLGAVIFSFRVSGETSETNADSTPVRSEDSKQVREEMEQYKEELINSASEELSRISNDKLLGMNEYSEEVLARMTKNHEEVVFLYDMLKEKEEDVKDLVHHVDSVKAQIHNETAQEYQKIMDALKKLQGSRIAVEAEASQPEDTNRQPDEAQKKKKNKNLKSTQAQKLTKDLEKKSREARETVEEDDSEDVASENPNNHNAEIIKLYKEGNSVFDISKLLSIGQGEVKLVIDLYKASR